MQITHVQGIALVQAIVVGRISEDQRQDAVIDQVLPVDACKAFRQHAPRAQISRCHGIAKDYEFSRRTMEEHWQFGYDNAVRTLSHPEVIERPTTVDGVRTFDFFETDRRSMPKDDRWPRPDTKAAQPG